MAAKSKSAQESKAPRKIGVKKQKEINSNLLAAAATGDLALAKELAPQATNLTGLRWCEDSPLICSARCGKIEMIRFFLPLCDPLHGGSADTDALSAAVFSGNAECVKLLLPHVVAAKSRDRIEGAIDMAVNLGRHACAKLLIEACEGDEAKRARRGLGTPLMRAASKSDLEMIKLLLPHSDAKATDEDGLTALMCACQVGRGAARQDGRGVELLLPFSDPMAVDKGGKTAIEWATKDKSWECADLLAEHSPKHAAQAAFEQAGPKWMPRWAAAIEAKELRRAAGLGGEGREKKKAGAARSRSRPARRV